MNFVILSDSFFEKHLGCSQMLTKRNRPYVCLAVKIDGIVFAIPFRHNIPHKYAFKTGEKCGIDYSKAVVISSRSDIATTHAQIEQKEYNKIKNKEKVIATGMKNYLKLYRSAIAYKDSPFYKNILEYSALAYFHKELGI